jgi:hypothetical protein
MAKQRLISEPPETSKTSPKARFSEIATKVFSVPKSEIDKREEKWRNDKSRRKA